MRGFHAPQPGCGRRNIQAIEGLVIKIPDDPAPGADEMVVGCHVRVEADAVVERPQCRNKAEPLEQAQGPIDGIQGYGGHPPADAAVDRFDAGVFPGPGQLSEDLDPLMGHLDAGIPDDVLEMVHHRLELSGSLFHPGGLYK